MAGDLNFTLALRNTFLLVITVVPIQVALALMMGTMLQKMTRGRDLVLWVWTIPLGVSDLAAGLVWLAVLQDSGYLNSALYALGLIDGPRSWLNAEAPVDAVPRRGRGRGVARDRDRAGHPGRRPAADPEGIRRGRRSVRREPVGEIPQDHAAAAQAEPAVGADPAHRAGVRGVRRGLRDRRPQHADPGGRGLCRGSATTRTTASPRPMPC